MTPPRVLIIAGSDSGGGAGFQGDIKTVTMLGGFAMTAITAITAQNTLGVEAVLTVPTDNVMQQFEAVIGDIGADVIKIGMIGSAETASAVAERLEQLKGVPVVFDPVMVATSGDELADQATIDAFARLMRISTLVTPNAPELAVLSGRPVDSAADIEGAALTLHRQAGTAVLAKGGDLQGDELVDVLVAQGQAVRWGGKRIDTPHTHGTGCTLASAIATGLGSGMELREAVELGREFVRRALLAAPRFGGGHGPMGHHAVRDLSTGTSRIIHS